MIISYRNHRGKVTSLNTPAEDPIEEWVMQRVEPYRPKHMKDQYKILYSDLVLLSNELRRQIALDINRFGNHDTKLEYLKDIESLLKWNVPFYRATRTSRYSL